MEKNIKLNKLIADFLGFEYITKYHKDVDLYPELGFYEMSSDIKNLSPLGIWSTNLKQLHRWKKVNEKFVLFHGRNATYLPFTTSLDNLIKAYELLKAKILVDYNLEININFNNDVYSFQINQNNKILFELFNDIKKSHLSRITVGLYHLLEHINTTWKEKQ